MNSIQPHNLPVETLQKVFLDQVSVLYNSKAHLINCMPKLIEQATFRNLKLALSEDMDDTLNQMVILKTLLDKLGQQAITEDCLGIDAIMKEAQQQIMYNDKDFYASDMSVIFYMNVIEHLQIGACRILKVITEKPEFSAYAQLVKESLDMNKDNAKLFKVVAGEYLGVINN